MAMGGVGDTLTPKLIAEIGDVRRFHIGKTLVAYAGIDAPPYQSGKFMGTNRTPFFFEKWFFVESVQSGTAF